MTGRLSKGAGSVSGGLRVPSRGLLAAGMSLVESLGAVADLTTANPSPTFLNSRLELASNFRSASSAEYFPSSCGTVSSAKSADRARIGNSICSDSDVRADWRGPAEIAISYASLSCALACMAIRQAAPARNARVKCTTRPPNHRAGQCCVRCASLGTARLDLTGVQYSTHKATRASQVWRWIVTV